MKRSNFLKMLMIALLTLSFNLTSKAQSQSDSICYSLEDAKIIAELLIDGRDCADELLLTLQSYKDAKDELKRYERIKENDDKEILALGSQIATLEKKKKRRGVLLTITSGIILIMSTQL